MAARSRTRRKKFVPLVPGRETPAQLRAQAEDRRRMQENRRLLCNAFRLFLVCREKRCRRAHACAGDPFDCYRRWWWLVPEEQKVLYRVVMKARADGLSHEDAVQAATAEVARCADLIAESNAAVLARVAAIEAGLEPDPTR